MVSPKPHFFRESRPCCSVVRRNHRVIDRKIPLLTIFFWCELIMCYQVPLEWLEFFAILKTDKIIWCDWFPDRDCWPRLCFHRHYHWRRSRLQAGKRCINLSNQVWQFTRWNRIMANVGSNDLSGDFGYCNSTVVFQHFVLRKSITNAVYSNGLICNSAIGN